MLKDEQDVSDINKPSAEMKESSFAAMDGGAYYIQSSEQSALILGLANLLRNNDYKLGLVPVIGDKCIFFADIDDIPAATLDDFSFDAFMETVASCYNANVKSPVDLNPDDFLIFVRENDDKKYHIYAPNTITTKKQRANIWKAVNKKYNKKIIDLSASTIRIEGFEKWDRHQSKFIAGSRYIPKGRGIIMLPSEILEKVWLQPRGWPEESFNWMLPTSSPRRGGSPSSFEPDGESDEKSLSLARTSQSSAAPAAPRASSEDLVHEDVSEKHERMIQLKFPEVCNVLLQYPIVKIQANASSDTATFICNKSEKGRTCKIAKTMHTKNNIYLSYNKNTGVLNQKCFSPSCKVIDPSPTNKKR